MNATPAGSEQEERAELARLLPAGPVERGLPPGLHSHHKDVLMQLIDREDDVKSPAGARRFSRPVLLAASVAVAVAATLTVGLASGRQEAGGHPGAAGPATAGRGAVVTLDRIAAVALRGDVQPVKDSQFVYVRTRTAENEADWGRPLRPGSLHDRETVSYTHLTLPTN